MEKLHFKININATAERVYTTMLDKQHFCEWTAEFNPSSRFEGSWEKGAKILFLGEDKDGQTGGMVSRIKENIPFEFVSIEHLGMVSKGNEVTDSSEIDEWAGAMENYTFTEKDGITTLSVDVDSNKEFKSYFIGTWPKVLNKLKSICEAQI